MALRAVTDPGLLAQLNTAPSLKPVTDPTLLQQLDASPAPRDPNDPPLLPGEAGFDNTPSKEPSMLDRAARYGGEYLSGLKQAGSALLQAPPSLQGAAEAFGTMATGALAGGVGAIRSKITGEPYEQAAEASIYQPRSASGQAMLGAVGAAAKPVTDLAERTGADVALAPLAGEMQALRAGQQFAQGQRGLKTAAKQADRQRPSVPAAEELADASTALYAQADQAGVVIHPKSTARAAAMIRQVADKENLGRLPPKISEAVSILEQRVEQNRPLTLGEADKVRQMIGDAFASTDATDRRLAAIIKERYDETYLGKLGPQDTLAGNAPEAVAILNDARAMYRRKSNAELIERAIHEAERKGEGKYTQGGEEIALRNEFEKIARNKKLMSTFAPEQQEAIEQVVKGGKITNTLRNLGKFDPAKGGMGATLGGVMGGGGGAALGAIALGGAAAASGGAALGAVGLGGAAHLAARGALRGTRANVARAREALVGRGLPQQNRLSQLAPVEDAAAAPPSAAPASVNNIAQLAPAPVKATPAAPGYVPPDSELVAARMEAQKNRPDLVASFGADELSQPLRASDVRIAPSKRAGFFDVVVDGKPITSVKGEAAAQELADGLIAEDAFAAERAAAAESARGGYAVEESPGENIVMETRPRRAARSATAIKTERSRPRNRIARLAGDE